MVKNITPYDTGKVKIGVYYTPMRKPTDIGTYAEAIQRALLKVREPWYVRAYNKVLGRGVL